MAVRIKLLGAYVVTSANVQQEAYAVPADAVGTIVNNIRIINIHSSNPVLVNLYIKKGAALETRILEYNRTLAAKQCIVVKPEILLEPGDKLFIQASVANVVQYVISGVEKLS